MRTLDSHCYLLAIALVAGVVSSGCNSIDPTNTARTTSALETLEDIDPGDSTGPADKAALFCRGRKPLAPICNVPECVGDAWEFVPVPRGEDCSNALGRGDCDGEGRCVVAAGFADPQYYILSIIYAPPGHTGASGQGSIVSYARGSTVSAATETTKSFKSNTMVSAAISILSFTPEVILSGSYSESVVSTNSLAMTKTAATTITSTGPPTDGVNHDEDSFYLWLNPRVNLADANGEVIWTFTVNPAPPFDGSMDIQHVKVGQLKGTLPMPPGLRAELEARGITPAHYAELLSNNPFAGGSTFIDPNQFVRTTTSFPYEPPTSPGGPTDSFQMAITNSLISSTSVTKTVERTVGLTVSTGSLASWMIGKLSSSQQWTWGTTNKNTTINGSNESATVTVKGPSFGYAGPTNMAVFYDTIYKTFMFQPIVVAPAVRGIVFARNKSPVIHHPVSLTVGDVEYHTITTRGGEYRFFDIPRGVGKLSIGNIAPQQVQITDHPQHIDLAL
jgi:hypothetical protein